MQESILSIVKMHPIWTAYISVNLLLFLLMGLDKLFARAQFWRIAEKTLFLFAILFGAVGGLLGMIVFSHKTKKSKFQFGFGILAIIQIAAIYFIKTTNWQSVFN